MNERIDITTETSITKLQSLAYERIVMRESHLKAADNELNNISTIETRINQLREENAKYEDKEDIKEGLPDSEPIGEEAKS